MRLIKLDERRGEIELIPESIEDLCLLSILIRPGDMVYSWTTRQMRVGGKDDGKGSRGDRVKVFLGIEVVETELGGMGGHLRIRGIIREAPDWLPAKGRHHTLAIQPGYRLRIVKSRLTRFELSRLRRAVERRRLRILVVAVDYGEATVALVTDSGVHQLAHIERGLPGKAAAEERRAAVARFMKEVAEAVLRASERERCEHVVIVGPGLAKHDLAGLLRGKVKILIDDASSADLGGVYEALRRGAERRILRECEAIEAQRAIEEALARLGRDDPRVSYGIDDVEHAATMGAVATLVVDEGLLRDPSLFERVLGIIEKVESAGGRVLLLPRGFELSDTLRSLGGLVALLRFSAKPG